jgi:hypothetical protein
MYARVFTTSQTSQLRTNNIFSNGFRAIDHLQLGNAAWGGAGLQGTQLNSMPDSLFRIGLKAGLTQILIGIGAQVQTQGSLAGFVGNVDSFLILNAFDSGTIMNSNQLVAFGEECIVNQAGFALPTPIFPLYSNCPAPPASPLGTGRFAIITSLSIVDPSDYPFVFAVPPEIWRKTSGRPGLAIAMLLMILAPYPSSIFSIDAAVLDINSANLTQIAAVLNASLVSIGGATTIYFLVESNPGADIPYTANLATASTSLQFAFADAVSNYNANAPLQISYESNLFGYEMTSMIFSWWPYMSTNLFWEVAMCLPRICARLDDFNAGVNMASCLSMRYKMMITSASDNAELASISGASLLGCECTDFASIRPQMLTADLPQPPLAQAHYTVPSESLLFITCCVMELVTSTRSDKGTYADWFGTALQTPYIFDTLRMYTRTLAAAWDLLYLAMGQSVAAWNNLVTVVPPGNNIYDNYVNNKMENYQNIRQLMRDFYINTASMVPPVANGSYPVRAALAKYIGFYLPKDSYGNTWERYRNMPTNPGSTSPNPNGGPNEILYAYAGVIGLVNGVLCDCACYIPQTLTNLEKHSVFFKQPPKALSWWPLPFSKPIKPLKAPGAMTIQAVVNGATTFSFPMLDTNINILGSRSQIQLPDEFYYLLRVTRQTAVTGVGGFNNCLFWGQINGQGNSLGRCVITNNLGRLNSGLYPQKSLAAFNNNFYHLSNDFYCNDTYIPATNIDGTRNCIFIDTTVSALAWQNFSGWMKGTYIVWANTILGSMTQEPLAAIDNQNTGVKWNVDEQSTDINANETTIPNKNKSKDEAKTPPPNVALDTSASLGSQMGSLA